MLDPDVTWGDLRAIHENAVSSGMSDPDDILADPELLAASQNKEDSDYYFPLSDEDKAFWKDLRAKEDIDSQPGTVSVTISQTGDVLELIKVLDDDGSIYVRDDHDWALVRPDEQDEPTIFDQTLADVDPSFVQYWDRLKDQEAPITKEVIQNFLI